MLFRSHITQAEDCRLPILPAIFIVDREDGRLEVSYERGITIDLRVQKESPIKMEAGPRQFSGPRYDVCPLRIRSARSIRNNSVASYQVMAPGIPLESWG